MRRRQQQGRPPGNRLRGVGVPLGAEPGPDPGVLGDPDASALERYDALFRQHPHAIFSLDLEGRFTSLNPASEEVSGYPEAELLGVEMVDLLPPEAVVSTLEMFVSLRDGRARELEVPFVHRTGRVVELSLTAVPIVIRGEVRGVYGIAEDVGHRNLLARELQQARLAAEEATRAKSLFLATVSHEIRTPLTSVLASVELLTETGLDALQARLVRVMARQGERLLDLVDHVLDFSRIEAGRAELHRVDFGLREVVGDTLRALAASAAAKGIDLGRAIDDHVPDRLHGDAARLAQVLTNLVGNAVKFTETGSVAVEVRPAHGATPDPAAGELRLLFSVTDTGIGVDPGAAHQLFESFSQADHTIPHRYGGTGLGLSISRGLVELMGGSIDVESTPGVGSRFWFEVPLGLART